MSTIKLFAVALIACAASFSVQPRVLLAQSTDRNDNGLSGTYTEGFAYDYGAGSESLEIIPNPNSARLQNYLPRTDYRAHADHPLRTYPPALRGRDSPSSNVRATDDFARSPAYRQPYRAPYQSTLEAERAQDARRYGDRRDGDRRDYELRRAQYAEGESRFNRPQDYDHRQSGHRGCRGGSCRRNHRQGYDEGQPFDGPIPPYAEPPYIERGPLNRDEADLPPQLGIYRPSQRLPYRN